VIDALVQLPLVLAVHPPFNWTVVPVASLMSQVPVALESQPVPTMWNVQIALPTPVSFTTAAVALLQAHAGLAPAVEKKRSATLMRIAKYPAALRILASVSFQRSWECARRAVPCFAEKQGPLHYFFKA